MDSDSEQAFQTLVASLAAALDESLTRHAAMVQKGKFDTLEAELELQRKLVAARKKLQTLRKTWPLPVGELPVAAKPAPPRQKAKRPPRTKPLKRGQKTPDGAYVLPILQALDEMGGRGATADVIDRVGKIMQSVLNELDRATLPTGELRWRNVAQWVRFEMTEQGLLAANSRRGIWEITEQGRDYLREHKKESL